jgi:RNA-binding protein
MAQTRGCLVALGRAGASPELAGRLAVLLAQHELVKVRLGDHPDSKRGLAADLARATGGELVRLIGNVAVYWKQNPDPDKRKIQMDR